MVGTRIDQALLNVENLYVHFPIKAAFFGRAVGFIRAVDGISLVVRSGQTMGLVGESGCGKTTLAKSIVRLVPANAGRVVFERTDVLKADRTKLSQVRRQIGLIFQDPFGSLNPRMSIGNMIGEPLKVHKGMTGNKLRKQVAELLAKVGLSADHMNRYPHEFSGGQRQRIAIARALAAGPKLLICDEPVSALDVSVQATVLKLFRELKGKFHLTYVFISHDLAVIRMISQRVAVMYLGKIVEEGNTELVFESPIHPYTRLLLAAIPQIKSEGKVGDWDNLITGEPPNPENIPPGCRFRLRCPTARGICVDAEPELVEISDGRKVACHL